MKLLSNPESELSMNAINPPSIKTPEDFEDAGGISQENLVTIAEHQLDFSQNTKLDAELDAELDIKLDAELLDAELLDAKLNSVSFFPQHRYLMTQIGQQQLAFPLQWVSELILVEQSHILPLPFYDPTLIGVLHYRGDIVPLIMVPLASKTETTAAIQHLRIKRTLTAVRLNQAVGKLAGVGLIVDRVIERIASRSVLEQSLETAETAVEISQVRIFRLEDIPPMIWQPR